MRRIARRSRAAGASSVGRNAGAIIEKQATKRACRPLIESPNVQTDSATRRLLRADSSRGQSSNKIVPGCVRPARITKRAAPHGVLPACCRGREGKATWSGTCFKHAASAPEAVAWVLQTSSLEFENAEGSGEARRDAERAGCEAELKRRPAPTGPKRSGRQDDARSAQTSSKVLPAGICSGRQAKQ